MIPVSVSWIHSNLINLSTVNNLKFHQWLNHRFCLTLRIPLFLEGHFVGCLKGKVKPSRKNLNFKARVILWYLHAFENVFLGEILLHLSCFIIHFHLVFSLNFNLHLQFTKFDIFGFKFCFLVHIKTLIRTTPRFDIAPALTRPMKWCSLQLQPVIKV